MSVEISEIRPVDHDAVEALLRVGNQPDGQGHSLHQPATPAMAGCDSVLSLVARDQGTIVAAILCYRDHQEGYLHHVRVADPQRYPHVARALVDKALHKLNAQGAHKCRINLPQETDQLPFWETAKWATHSPLTHPPLPSSAVTDRLTRRGTAPPETGEDEGPDLESVCDRAR